MAILKCSITSKRKKKCIKPKVISLFIDFRNPTYSKTYVIFYCFHHKTFMLNNSLSLHFLPNYHPKFQNPDHGNIHLSDNAVFGKKKMYEITKTTRWSIFFSETYKSAPHGPVTCSVIIKTLNLTPCLHTTITA